MKTCNVCEQQLPLTHFAKQREGKQGRRASCKECVKNKYRHSKRGLVWAMHANQRAKSKKRNHPQPSYTQQELLDWCIQNPIFDALYQEWKNSGYLSDLIPTCDRLDDYLPYSLDNIQLLTFKENSNKYYIDSKNGINTKACTPVICLDTDFNVIAEYHSIVAAARAVNTSHSNIRNVCEQKPLIRKNTDGSVRTWIPRHCKGYVWRYKEK